MFSKCSSKSYKYSKYFCSTECDVKLIALSESSNEKSDDDDDSLEENALLSGRHWFSLKVYG